MTSRNRGRSRPGLDRRGRLFLGILLLLVHLSVGWGALLAPWGEVRPEILAISRLSCWAAMPSGPSGSMSTSIPATEGSFLRSFRLILIHNLFNNLLPMRSGEASFPILMAREFSVPFSRSIPGLVYLRVSGPSLCPPVWGSWCFSWAVGPRGLDSGCSWLPFPRLVFEAKAGFPRLEGPGEAGLGVLQGHSQGLPATPGLSGGPGSGPG